MHLLNNKDAITDEHTRAVVNMAYTIVAEDTFSGLMSDKVTAHLAYQQRIHDVKKTISEDRLLTFDVSQGWGPLCAFLNLPEPKVEFPRTNSSAKFNKR